MKKKKSTHLYSILLLPLFLFPIESQFSDTKNFYKVENKIQIVTTIEKLWPQVVEVEPISDAECDFGFYNYLGIPRPLKAEIVNTKNGPRRIGHFSDEFKLIEEIVSIDTFQQLVLKIYLANSTIRNKPTDKHILQGGHFSFENISYTPEEVNPEMTELHLTCTYRINSKMNWYANFWAEKIIEDFETKLLKVIKYKVEKK